MSSRMAMLSGSRPGGEGKKITKPRLKVAASSGNPRGSEYLNSSSGVNGMATSEKVSKTRALKHAANRQNKKSQRSSARSDCQTRNILTTSARPALTVNRLPQCVAHILRAFASANPSPKNRAKQRGDAQKYEPV